MAESGAIRPVGLGALRETRGLTAHGSPETFHRKTAPHAFC